MELVDLRIDIPQPGASLYLHPPYTREQRLDYLQKGWPLYKAATEGDWDVAQRIIDDAPTVVRAYITEGLETMLHMAALANEIQFVENLISLMLPQDLEIKNRKGFTALHFAVANGNVVIVRLMIKANSELPKICSNDGVLPIQMAAKLGYRDMVLLLWSSNEYSIEEDIKVVIDCINSDLFDIALRMMKGNSRLAVAKDTSGETALGILAKKPFAFLFGGNQGKCQRLIDSCLSMEVVQDGTIQRTQYTKLLRHILHVIFELKDDMENSSIIATIPPLLFVAAILGNFEFVNLLMHYYPELIWKVNNDNQSIFHIATEHRHERIFALLHHMDAVRSLLTTFVDKNGNNMLHLASKLAPKDKLNTVSGEAFQMQKELLWYKEVEEMVPPAYKNMQNNEGRTPTDVFDLEHEELMENGERWVKGCSKSCMLVATLIATMIFAAAFTVPGGNDNEGHPLLFKKVLFEIFAISEVIALFSSATSIVIFLSILTLRVTKHAFLHSLPSKLMIGVTMLFISIITMVVTFCTTMFLSYRHGSTWIPFILLLFSCVPIMFLSLKFRLMVDIVRSTSVACFRFRPT